ncbi:uncharacterized protein LOC131889094 [Tigriopus californicus]|uniref:uncharacterized protein LOC131889094 n=1 Tax=Tigriopus californicus TaxID=6832 RepID=UPI0027DA0940|nr:uncharacterized protein LOC131889094 [Tigriopus californicus]|eukprot:TCALIF_05602-PA protein Name:"Protein of unknown function" AED:0.02 eAED:0.02 QI:0/-1/0/1/-1/1/1/0/529
MGSPNPLGQGMKMPNEARGVVRSLAHICIKNVIANMENLWCRKFVEHFFKQAHWLYVIGPFDSLPPKLCHDIFESMIERKLLRKHHVYLMIHPNFTKLNCSRESNELALILSLVSTRCAALQELNLSGCAKLPKTVFLEEFPTISKHLRHLDLSHSSASDDILSVVGVYGQKLVSLKLSYTNVTDLGLRTLFFPVNLDGKPDPRYGQVKSLQSLDIFHCGIRSEVASQILSANPKLKELIYEDSVDAVAHSKRLDPEAQIHLTTLHSVNPDLEASALDIALRHCHYLGRLYVSTFKEMNVSAFESLSTKSSTSSTHELKEIHVTNEQGINAISMIDVLSPVLFAHGNNLLSLNLAEVRDVCIPLLVQTCRQLVHLSLQFNEDYVENVPHYLLDETIEKRLPRLRTLKVLCQIKKSLYATENIYPGSSDLKILLISPKLANIHLSHCETLNDSVLLEILSENTLNHLTSLELDNCNEISFEGLAPILQGENNLNQVSFKNCKEISRKHAQSYQKYLKQKKLFTRVQMDWS